MPDYKAMYFRLFSRVSDAVELLETAQQSSEDSFIEGQDGAVVEAKKPDVRGRRQKKKPPNPGASE